MKHRMLAVIITISFILSLFTPFSVSASDELYSEEKEKDFICSELTNSVELNGSLDNFDTLISDDSHHLRNNRVVSKAMLNFADSNNTIENEYVINADCAYDHVSVTYLSTEGVTLNSKSYISDDISVTMSFTPHNPFIEQSTKNVYDYQEDKVIMSISFWNNDEIECTEAVEISIFYTPFGTFFSEIDPILSKRNYTRYLLSNGIIDEATYEDLNAIFHCFSENTSPQINLKLAEFDSSLSSNDQIKLTSVITDKYSVSNNGVTTLATRATKSDYAEVIYNIQSLDEGDRLRVYGYVYWYGTSSASNTSGKKYPAQYVNVDIIDKDVAFDDLIATVKTSSSGYFSYTFDNQSIEGGRDIYLKVYSGNDDTMVYDFGSFDFFASGIFGPLISYNIEPYYFTTAVTSDITTSKSNLEGYSSSGSVISKAFSIGNALYYAREYEKYINGGSTLNNITVKLHYPLPIIETSFTLPVLDMGAIMLDEDDYSNWGTIMHEYGHAVADKLEIFVGYLSLFSKHGFEHVATYNLTDYYEGNKNKALKISWNEGWASYYSLCVQRKYSLQSKGYPKASDTSIWNYNIVNNAFYGEDNELAIAATMINLITQNIFTESELWNIIKIERPQSFHELNNLVIDEIIAEATSTSLPISELNKYFSILEKQNISAETSSANVSYSVSSFGPTFSWLAPETYSNNPNGTTFNYKYKVAILSTDPVYTYISPETTNTSYTIPSVVWADIIDNCTNGFYWTIIADEVTTPASGGYYSKLYNMTYTPESITVWSSDRYREDQTVINAGKCYDYKVTFKTGGNKLIQTFGTKDTVLELYSMEGTRLLGKSDTDDRGYSTNALLSYNFSANTEYIVRVRFYSSSTSGTTKIAIIPTYSYATYEDIYSLTDYTMGLTWSFAQNNVKVMTYKYSAAQDLTMNVTSEVDTYLYIIDPRSTELIKAASTSTVGDDNLYNDDYGGTRNSKITKTFDANVPYLVIVSAYNPSSSTSVGEFYVDFD